MFLLRSAFWLTVMFLLVAPRDVDVGKTAGEYSRQAIAAGQQAIVTQVLAGACDSLECAGGKAVLGVLAAPRPPADAAPASRLGLPVPLPRPRPERLG